MKEQFDALVMQIYKGGIRYGEALQEFRKAFITVALQDNNGNICRVAPNLGLHRNTLRLIIAELDLDAARLRARRRPPGKVSAIPEKKAVR